MRVGHRDVRYRAVDGTFTVGRCDGQCSPVGTDDEVDKTHIATAGIGSRYRVEDTVVGGIRRS